VTSGRSARTLTRSARSFSHSQLPCDHDGILDRLVHNAHPIEMRGDSMRKNRSKTNN
jgi:DNA replication protein DnaC